VCSFLSGLFGDPFFFFFCPDFFFSCPFFIGVNGEGKSSSLFFVSAGRDRARFIVFPPSPQPLAPISWIVRHPFFFCPFFRQDSPRRISIPSLFPIAEEGQAPFSARPPSMVQPFTPPLSSLPDRRRDDSLIPPFDDLPPREGLYDPIFFFFLPPLSSDAKQGGVAWETGASCLCYSCRLPPSQDRWRHRCAFLLLRNRFLLFINFLFFLIPKNDGRSLPSPSEGKD